MTCVELDVLISLQTIHPVSPGENMPDLVKLLVFGDWINLVTF